MKKFIFMITLTLSVSAIGFAQTYPSQEEAEKAAQENVREKLTELLTSMQNGLQDADAPKAKFNNGTDKVKQFLYDGKKVNKFLAKKETTDKDKTLKNIYTKLTQQITLKENPYKTDFQYFDVQFGEVKVIKQEGKQNGYKLNIPVSFQTYTVTGDSASLAKYEVKSTWEVAVGTKKQKVAKLDSIQRQNDSKDAQPVLSHTVSNKMQCVGLTAKSIDFLNAEQKTMNQLAEQAIVDWYANVQQNLEQKYIDQAIAPIAPIAIKSVKFDSQNGKTFKIGQMKEILISIDPKPYMTEPEVYYENPTAILTVKPAFTVTISDDLTGIASLEVAYEELPVEAPKTAFEKMEMRTQADKLVSVFTNKLSEYVATNNAQQKEELLSMFECGKTQVQVSHVSQNAKERIANRQAEKYLNCLKGLKWDVKTPTLIDEACANQLNTEYPTLSLQFDPSLNTMMYLINQRYEGQNYKDDTQKIIFVKYNEGKYQIQKVVVVPNSTKLVK